MVVLGRFGAPWGVKGWIKAESYTDPPAGILDYPVWYLSRPQGSSLDDPGAWDEIRTLEGRPHCGGAARRHSRCTMRCSCTPMAAS